jgi:WD40 repeat protein
VTLDNQGRAEVSFTASNTGPKSIAGRAKLVPLGSAKAAWLSLEGEQERNFAKGEAHQLTVHIAVPPGTPVGKYSFRLNIISVENPDDEFTEGPSVSFEVKELAPAAPPARKFPWWIVAVAAVVVLGAGIITWLLIPQKVKVPNPKKDESVAPGTVIPAFVEPAYKILRGHEGSVLAVAISQDNHWLVTGSADKTARLWDLSAKDPTANPVVLRGHEQSVFQKGLAISPNSHWLVTGSADKTARLWDLSARDPATNPVVLRSPPLSLATFYAVAISDRWVVTGSDEQKGTARLWDLSASDPATNPVVLRGHEGTVYAVAISPDSHWLVTGSGDKTARLWDLSANDPAANPMILLGHEGSVRGVAISNRWVVTGSDDKTARLWDLSARDPAANPVVLAGHEGAVTNLAISPDNHWLVTAGRAKTARLWDLSAKDPAANPVVLAGHEGPLYDVKVAISNRWVVTSSDDKTARLWDLSAKGPGANPVVLRGHEGLVYAVAISPDNHWLVTCSDDKTARLWDLRKLTALSSPREAAAE